LETLLQVLQRQPPPPRRLNPQINRDLETICLKCLKPDAAARYGSAEALAEDLERWLRSEPILARPASSWERMRMWARRKPAVAALAAVSGLAVLAIVVVLLFSNFHVTQALEDRTAAYTALEREQKKTEEALDRERRAVGERTQALERERWIAYLSRI